MNANRDLVEDIRDYWSRRSETFDLSFGHAIAPEPEAAAWAEPMRAHLGPPPARVLELACGTGEVTRVFHDLGHDVTPTTTAPWATRMPRSWRGCPSGRG